MTNGSMVRANGVDLCIDTFGDPANPCILLIGGGAASMDWWEDGFCQRLAEGDRYVVRYDQRDTGQSTSYPPGHAPYAIRDLAADAVGILDALDVDRAHIVGLSMGGGIAQVLGVGHPDRVASLTLVSTTPGGPHGPDNPDLPPMSDDLGAAFSGMGQDPDWTDRSAVVDYLVAGERIFTGTIPFDEARARAIAGRVYDRTTSVEAGVRNHFALDGGEPVRPRLGQIVAPTLVIHGTADPLYPYAHAQALASEIPGAELLPVEGMGHQYPPPAVWDLVITAILTHTAAH